MGFQLLDGLWWQHILDWDNHNKLFGYVCGARTCSTHIAMLGWEMIVLHTHNHAGLGEMIVLHTHNHAGLGEMIVLHTHNHAGLGEMIVLHTHNHAGLGDDRAPHT